MASTPMYSMGDINPSFLKRFTHAQIEDKVNARRDTVPEYFDLLMQSKVGEDKDGAIFDSSHPSWNKLIVTVRERERAKTNGTLMQSPISLITVPVQNGPVCTNVQQEEGGENIGKVCTVSETVGSLDNTNTNTDAVDRAGWDAGECGGEVSETNYDGEQHDMVGSALQAEYEEDEDEEQDPDRPAAAAAMPVRQFVDPVGLAQPTLDVLASFVSELFTVDRPYVEKHLERFPLYAAYTQLRKIFLDLEDWWTLPQYEELAAYCELVFGTTDVFVSDLITSVHFVLPLDRLARSAPLTPSTVPDFYLPRAELNVQSLSKLAQKCLTPNCLRFLVWKCLITGVIWTIDSRDKYKASLPSLRAGLVGCEDAVDTQVYISEKENGLLHQRKEACSDPTMYPAVIIGDLTFDICEGNTAGMSAVAQSSARVISVDVVRTLSSVMMFTDTSIRRIVGDLLMSYCLDANIEYKQGMNYILAPLLFTRFPLYTGIGQEGTTDDGPVLPLTSEELITSSYSGSTLDSMHYIPSVVASLKSEEEEMVTLLDKLLKHIAPNLYDDNDFYSLQCHFVIFRLLLQYHDAQMSVHLDSNDIGPELYSSPWLLTIHVNKAKRFDAQLAVWDRLCAYFVYDNLLHIYISLALMLSNREAILATKDVFLPEVLSGLVIVSPDHAQVLLEMALELRENTPESTRQLLRQISTEFYRPGKHDARQSEQSRSELRLLQSMPVVYMTPEEIVQNCFADNPKFCFLDTRTKREFGLGHLPNSANIDPSMLANLGELTPILAQQSAQHDHGMSTTSYLQHSHNTHFVIIYSTERAFNVRNAMSLSYILLSMGCSHVSFGQWGYDLIHDLVLSRSLKLSNHIGQNCDVCLRKSRNLGLKNASGRRDEALCLPGGGFASDIASDCNTNDEGDDFEVVPATIRPLPPQPQISGDEDFEIMNVDIFKKDKSGRCSLVLYPDLQALEESGTAVNQVHISEIGRYLGRLAQNNTESNSKGNKDKDKDSKESKDKKSSRFFSNVGSKASNVLTSMRSKQFKEGNNTNSSSFNTPEDTFSTTTTLNPPILNLDVSNTSTQSVSAPTTSTAGTTRLENCLLLNPYSSLFLISAYSNLRNFNMSGVAQRNSVTICISELINKALTIHSQPPIIARKKGNPYATTELANMLAKEELWKMQRVDTMSSHTSAALDCDNVCHYLGIRTMREVTILSLARSQVKFYLRSNSLGDGKYHVEDHSTEMANIMQVRTGQYHGVVSGVPGDYLYGYRQVDVFSVMISQAVANLQGVLNIQTGYIELHNNDKYIPTPHAEVCDPQLALLDMLPKSSIPPAINDSHAILLFAPVLDDAVLPDISPVMNQLLELDVFLDRVHLICFIATKSFLLNLAERWPSVKVITLNVDKTDSNLAQVVQTQPVRVEDPDSPSTILTSMIGVLGSECYPHIVPGINELSKRYFGNEPI